MSNANLIGKTTTKQPYKALLLLIISALLWSTNGLFIKSLFAAHMSALNIAAFRSFFAALFLLPWAAHNWKPVKEWKWVTATVVAFTAMCTTFVLATTMTTAANAIILQYTAPVWVFSLAPWIIGEKATQKQWSAFFLSLFAVMFIFGAQCHSDLPGMLVGLLSGVVFGTQLVLFRRVRHTKPIVLTFLCCAGSCLLLIPMAVIKDGFQLSASNTLLVIIAGVFQFAVPYLCYAAAARHVSAQRAVLIIMIEPVLNPLWVFLAHGESPHWSTVIGGLVIIGTVSYLSITTIREPDAIAS